MLMGRVLGAAVATIKHASLQGCKLLIVQPLGADGQADGDPVLAVDVVGAGRGEMALLSSDGRGAREMLGVDATPVRWMIVGLRDEPL